MSADGSGQTNLTHNGAADMTPVFSPDGTKIAFTRYGGRLDHGQVFVMNANGSHQTQLTKDPTRDNALEDWQPLP